MARTKLCVKKERRSPSSDLVAASAQESKSSTPTTMTMSVKGEDSFSAPSLSTPSTTAMDVDLKVEPHMSPSQSPTLADVSDEKVKSPPTPSRTSARTNGTKFETPSPLPPLQFTQPSSNLRKSSSVVPRLMSDLPVARAEALSTFNEISENNYQYKTLGRYKELLESMTCDCTYEHGTSNPKDACGAGSDCINRLTQVECLAEDCRCGSYCQNQRFQHKEYADIEIILTEKKGYGLRAERGLSKDTFIYEYVGDVVNTPSFKKRMREYAEEGIEHFYFMMLQKDEFIDATKSGGIGRFANHSCNPNCYVAKWTIGDHVRMGIFAKRDIQRHEEITFNYNVDRYGHQAQPCYCGEPNCLGFIGGKTQTDIAAIDDLYLDALGITDEADILELKGTKKKKGKKIDDPDFMPTLKPITEKDVPKVVQAIRQTPSRKVLSKLLTRIRMTEDQAALRQIMRLRGYSLMTNVLEEYTNDLELIHLALQCMSTWPLLNRNKVEDSKVIVPVQTYCSLEANEDNEKIRSLAQQLLDHWETLPLYNRIPKRVVEEGEERPTFITLVSTSDDEDRPSKKARYHEAAPEFRLTNLPPSNPSQQWLPRPTLISEQARFMANKLDKSREHRQSIQAIIDQAAAAEEAAVAAEKAQQTSTVRKKPKPPKKSLSHEEKEANKEKRLLKLIGAVVVKCMSKYAKSLNRDLFKKYAKELTQVIAEKEKKSSSYKEGRLDVFSEEKTAKIKKYAKEYIAKIMRKVEKSNRDRPSSSAATTATPGETPTMCLDTPNSAEGGDTSMGMDMSLEEAMDMESESESEAGGDGGDTDVADDEEGDHERVSMIDTNGVQDMSPGGLAEASPLDHPISPDVANEPTLTDSTQPEFVTTDPRRRLVVDARC
ncbi:hypothetical protein AX17_005449 [Amanita inopinata Kibby_2008]|nr:hypothetical protein AX17_005449 [Amanita inopinata Kibby_2008]